MTPFQKRLSLDTDGLGSRACVEDQIAGSITDLRVGNCDEFVRPGDRDLRFNFERALKIPRRIEKVLNRDIDEFFTALVLPGPVVWAGDG